jgi:hypothetical protein
VPFSSSRSAVRVLGDADVADLAADLLVGVVRVQQRVELRVQHAEEDVRAGRGVEVVLRPPPGHEGRGADQRVALEVRHRAAHVPLAEQQVLLRVGLAHVRDQEGVHPHEGLRRRLEAQQVQGEAGAAVHEAAADRGAASVQVHRLGAEAVEGLPLRTVSSDSCTMKRSYSCQKGARPRGPP